MKPAGPLVEIRGTGPVGLAAAAFLARQGLGARVVFDAEPRPAPPDVASRPLALSEGSWQLLRRIVDLPPDGRIDTVTIQRAGHAPVARLGATDLGLPALGHVVRYGALHARLLEAVTRAGVLPSRADATALERGADDAGDEAALQRPVVVIAGGDPGPGDEHDFRQCALLTEVSVWSRHGAAATGVAHECFRAHGPLALLPLPEHTRRAVVWCDMPPRARELQTAHPEDFEAALNEALGMDSDVFSLVGPRIVVPLTRRCRVAETGNQVAIGNAAQTLHPVAGQGLNLGLRDAFLFASMIGTAVADDADPLLMLPRFRAARARDRRATVRLTDALADLHHWRLPGFVDSATLHAGALFVLDIASPLRRLVTQRFVFGVR